MFSIKRIAAAAALAAVAGSASAAITAGDLVLLAYDPVTTLTYVRDLGVTGAAITDGFSLAGDANWTAFFNAANSDVWTVQSFTGASTTTIGYTTANGLQPVTGSNLLSGLAKYGNLVAANSINTFSATNSAISGVANAGLGSDYAALSPDATMQGVFDASVGSSLNFEKTVNARGNVAATSLISTTSLFTLDSTGGLSYASPAVAAVPEPGTWALMIAGLLTVGAIARRRNAA